MMAIYLYEEVENTYFVSSHTDQINDPRIGDVLN